MNSNKNKKNILISPLHWGTGHATRIQALARELKKRGHRIIIASPPALHKIFDSSLYDELTGIWSPRVSYPRFLPLYLGVLAQLPLLFAAFLYDRYMSRVLIRRYDIDILISDNRFGMRGRKVYSIFVTHQPRVIVPAPFAFAGSAVSAIHRWVASGYEECWIPDLPGAANLSGLLSHECKLPPATRYIGILSRFSPADKYTQPCTGNDVETGKPGSGSGHPFTLAIMSGPEPQRSILEKIIISQKDKLPGELVIVAGSPGEKTEDTAEGVTRHAWLDGRSLRRLMCDACFIICRPGYSTIMDLFALGLTACLVPTPGQPEQEYLAGYLSASYGFAGISQSDLARAVSIAQAGMTIREDMDTAGTKGEPPAKTREENIDWNAESRMLMEEALDGLFRKQPSSAT
ncbi:MAG: glycosyltransferase [Bacteroidota bacterium]